MNASYAISVRQASALPAASFRFHLAMDTLAVRLTLPPVGCVADFHLQVSAPCRAHQKKSHGKPWLIIIGMTSHEPEKRKTRRLTIQAKPFLIQRKETSWFCLSFSSPQPLFSEYQ